LRPAGPGIDDVATKKPGLIGPGLIGSLQAKAFSSEVDTGSRKENASK